MDQLVTIAILFCSSCTIGLSQTPTVLKLNNKVQVTFPDVYEESTVRNIIAYKLKLADSTAAILALLGIVFIGYESVCEIK